MGSAETYYTDDQVTLWHGRDVDVLRTLPDQSVDCVVTSPPYFGLRDYDAVGQRGLESKLAVYIDGLAEVFSEVHRVLADDGTVWLNLGDSYQSSGGHRSIGENSWREGRANIHAQQKSRVRSELPDKNLIGVPWRVALALQDDGWILRNDVIWHKRNAMPESVTDRLSCTYEHVFLLTKQAQYWFDLDPIREPLAHPDAANGTRVFGGSNKGTGEGKVNGSARRGGGHRSVYEDTHGGRGRNPGDYWEIDDEPLTLPGGTITADEAAYIAAFIDGEGSICIRRRKRQIQLILTVVNTHEGVIHWLRDRTGMGQVKQREVRNENWRQVWEWSVSSRQAAQVIYAVYHHFRVKQQQAAIALNFMARTREAGGGVASADYHDERHAMAEDVAALNAGRITTSRFALDPDGPPRMSSMGDIWSVNTQPFPHAHFAVMAPRLAERCVLAGCKPGGTVLDPYSGAGTTGMVALRNGRRYVGIDVSRDALDLSLRTRLAQGALVVELEPA